MGSGAGVSERVGDWMNKPAESRGRGGDYAGGGWGGGPCGGWRMVEKENPVGHRVRSERPEVQEFVLADVSEEALLAGCARGDAGAVASCVRTFAPLVLAIARQTLKDPLLIEDGVHEVFIELWRCAARFDPSKGSARTFVATIARRRLIDRGRYEQARVKGVTGLEGLAEAVRGGVEDGAQRLASREDAERAGRMIDAMGEPQRTAVRLSLGEGWSHQRISDHLRVPLGTVKSMLRSTVLGLRERLSEAPTTVGTGGGA